MNTLVRVCDATYDKAPVEKEGIQVVVSVAAVLLRLSFIFFLPSELSKIFWFLLGLAL